MPTNRIIGIGEVLWDVFPDHRLPGGAPANVVFHAAQLGADAMMCSRVGQDALGDELLGYLSEHEIDTGTIQVDSEHATGTVTVDVSRPDHPSFVIHEDVAWDYMELSEEWKKIIQAADAVCFGSLAQRSPKSRETIIAGLDLAGEALRVFDVNLRPPWYDVGVIEHSLGKSSVVKFNDEEVGPLADMLETRTHNPGEFTKELLDRYRNVEAICITRGENGCLLVGREETVDVPGQKVEVADTVGAGDAFTAALTVGMLEGWPMSIVADFANRVAALVASRPGGMPALRDEFAKLRER